MNGVLKDSRVIRLLMAAALMLFLAACSSSSGVKNDRDMYKEQAEALQAQVDDLMDDLAEANMALETANENVSTLGDQITGLEGQITGLNGQITDLNGQITDLGGQITDLGGQITDLGGQVATLTSARDAAQMMVTDLEIRLMTAQGNAEELHDMLTMANADLMTAETNLMTAETNLMTAETNLETAQQNLTDKQDELDGVQGMLTMKTKELMDANDELGTVKQDLADANDKIRDLEGKLGDADKLAMSEKAKDVFTALKTPATVPATLVGEQSAVTATHGDPTTTIKGLTDFKNAETKAPAITGWTGEVVTHSLGKDRVGRVYTDIAPPTPTGFGKAYSGYSEGAGLALANTDRDLWKVADPDASSGKVAEVNGSDRTTFDGTFADVPGTYRCDDGNQSACQLPQVTTAGRVTTVVGGTGSWSFYPTGGANAVVQVADKEYLTFGVWIDTQDDDPVIGAFYSGNYGMARGLDTTNLPSVEGVATYSGAAAGKYATRVLGDEASYKGGYFTADATMKAHFGADPDAGVYGASDPSGETQNDWKLTGTISSLRDSDTTASLGGMKIVLSSGFESLINLAGTTQGSASGTASITVGSDKGIGAGVWSAHMYGDSKDDNVPEAVAGDFNVSHDTGAFLGSFGADRDQ